MCSITCEATARLWMMKRKPLSPKHIQTVSKEPVSWIQMAAIMLPRARVADEKARAELWPWVCCMSRMGSSLSTGSLDSSAPPAVPHHVLSTISRQIYKKSQYRLIE